MNYTKEELRETIERCEEKVSKVINGFGTQNVSSSSEFKEITCTICLDIIVGCRKAGCGHIFCQICIEEWLLRKKVRFDYFSY